MSDYTDPSSAEPSGGYPGPTGWWNASYTPMTGDPADGGVPPMRPAVTGPSAQPLAPNPPVGGGEGGGRGRRTVVAIAAAALIGAGAIGAVIGHAAWASGTSSSLSASGATANPGSGTTSPSSGTTPASGNAGSGSTGSSGSTDPFGGSGGSYTDPFGGSGSNGSNGSGGSLLNPFGGSSGSGGSASTSSGPSTSDAEGGPANPSTIAASVTPGLVDINTNLGYQGAEAAGTGMVLTSGGEVLTNNHVIDGATSIKVTDLGNGKTYDATVVGYDRTQDIAVLQLTDASGLKTVDLGDSSTVTTGEAVVGIGNAGGLGGTPSVAGGSVVALDQSITASDDGSNTEQLTGLIQTNAGIEPGDSGGPLVNSDGQVIGIDTAASSSGMETQAASSAQAYSIPIDEALSIARQIEARSSSNVVHIGETAFLGLEVSPNAANGTSQTSGVTVAGTAAGSPAASSGLAAGDTIVSIDGNAVSSDNDLTNDILQLKPGDKAQVVFDNQSGGQQSVTLTLASGPPQ